MPIIIFSKSIRLCARRLLHQCIVFGCCLGVGVWRAIHQFIIGKRSSPVNVFSFVIQIHLEMDGASGFGHITEIY